jgi:lactate dehydrogenase-like 2-hydroxyacid dehydrogenase
MKPGSVLINMGRGGIVDEAALYDALKSEHLGGLASDVFAQEPYTPVAPDKDLRTLPNTVFTPHCGSDTFEANARMASSAVAQAATFFGVGTAPLCRVEL